MFIKLDENMQIGDKISGRIFICSLSFCKPILFRSLLFLSLNSVARLRFSLNNTLGNLLRMTKKTREYGSRGTGKQNYAE